MGLLMVPGSLALEIELAHGSEREAATGALLERFVEEYDLEERIFTERVVIDERAIPHSHPVLTLHTRHLDEPEYLLSTFVHEQLHWFFSGKPDATTGAAKARLRELFPELAGLRPPEGARDLDSTFLHVMVCYLEWQAMRELLGDERARDLMEGWTHYTAIYRAVLDRGPEIERVLEELGLRRP